MNKTMLKICFVIALTMCAASAAYGAATISSSISMAGGSFSPSKNVILHVDSPATAGVSTAYTAYAKHTAGDRVVGFNSTDPKMYYKTTTIASSPDDPTTALPTATWTSM